jgi:DNA invertase Pin-like site-specific DNA recombinase
MSKIIPKTMSPKATMSQEVVAMIASVAVTFHIFGALAEFERDIIRERTNAGLQAARARGRLGGRPRALSPKQVEILHQLDKANTPVDDIIRTLRISRVTFYRYRKAG